MESLQETKLEDLSSKLIEKLDENFKRFLEKDFEALKSQFRQEFKSFLSQLKSEFSQISEEKTKLQKLKELFDKQSKENDEVLTLNVSGEKILVKSSTLSLVKGSNLEIMIKNKEKITKDKDGNIYLDFDPLCFKQIINFMKLKSIEGDNKPAPLPIIEPSMKEQFDFLANYLGVIDLFQTPFENDVFETKLGNIAFSENGQVCTSNDSGHKWTLGKNVYSKGINVFQFEVIKLLNNNWMLLGIIDTETNLNNNNSYGAAGYYGWAGSDQVYINGGNNSSKDGYNGKNDFLEKDTIILTLNLEESKLHFKNQRNGKVYSLEIPQNKKWKVHVNMHGQGDQLKFTRIK